MNIWNENLNQMKSFYIFCNVTKKKKQTKTKIKQKLSVQFSY